MNSIPRIAALAGSTKRTSVNKKLIHLAASAAERAGASVRVIDLAEFPLPIFNEDLESELGRPREAQQLTELLADQHGLLIASPEYNSSITPLLKNAIDWVSRPVPGQPTLHAFRGKVAALLSASPGALGGLRGLVHVRSILGNIGVIVLPDQVAIPSAHEAFDDSGALKSTGHASKVDALAQSLVRTAQRLMV